MRLALASLALAGLILSADPARADGAFPASQAILLPADRPDTIALATNFGLILSEDGGVSWQWTCERAETAAGSLYSMGAPPEDRMFSLSPFSGLAVSTDGSCSWRRPGGVLATLFATDAFPDPSDPAHVLAIALKSGGAGAGISSLYASHDSGDTFDDSPLFTAPDGASLTGVEIARSDPRVITLTMLLPGRTPALVRSRDGGETWTTTALEPMLGPSPVRLVAIDPANPELIVLLVAGTGGDELAITRDGGLSFVKPVIVAGGNLTAFVRLASGTMLVTGLLPSSPDGGGATAGVGWRSTDGGLTFQDWTLSPQPHLLALAERGGTLYLAGNNYTDGWALATSTDEGRTIQPLSTYDQVGAIKSCAAQACRDNCDYQAGLNIWSPQVCSTAPNGGSAEGGHRAGNASGCGCAVGASGDGFAPATLALLVVLILSGVCRRGPGRMAGLCGAENGPPRCRPATRSRFQVNSAGAPSPRAYGCCQRSEN